MAMKLIAAVLVSVWSTSGPPERVSIPYVEKARSDPAPLATTKVSEERVASSATPAPTARENESAKGAVLSQKRARVVDEPARSSPRKRGCSHMVL
jgi:hypothetical protein